MSRLLASALALLLALTLALPFDAEARGRRHGGGGGRGGHSYKASRGKSGAVHVRGYYRKNGTYVRPHMRSAPNGSKADNWSTKGNVNPYTGKVGTKSP